jgi:hypothetical protein
MQGVSLIARAILVLVMYSSLWIGGTSVAWSQKGQFIPDDIKFKTKDKDGWFPELNAGLNFSFSQNDGVVGMPDGTTLSLGLQLNGSLTFTRGMHEWRTVLMIVETQTKTPTIEPFLKSADKADLETSYTLRLPSIKWLGFFGALKLETPLLPGYMVRDTTISLKITEPDGRIDTSQTAVAQKPFDLTNAFAPLALKQSIGFSFLPYNEPMLRIDLKLGGGASQTFTQNGLRIDDNPATADVLELSRLQDYIQVGAEVRMSVTGRLFDNILSYALLGGIMVPFYSSVTNNLSTGELINYDLSLKLGIQVVKWLNINYSLGIIYTPLIQPKTQITNNLVLSFTWSIL